jgi:hypothetical protein
MKRWLVLAALVVVLTTTATVVVQILPGSTKPQELPYPAAPADAGPLPLAAVDGDPTYKFGMAAQQVKLEKDWTVRNEGKADLALTIGPPACSCTVANFANGTNKTTIKPGEATTIHLTFETRENNGGYHKSATLVTNDPTHPTLEFAADGIVRPSVVLYPPEPTVNFMEIANDTDDHHTKVALYSPDQPDMKITQIKSSRPDQVVVTQEPLPAEDCKQLKVDKGIRINVQVKGTMSLGIFREEVVLKTDHPKQPEVRLTVNGKMVGPIMAMPERLRMIPVSSRDGATGELKLTVRGLRPTTFQVEHNPEKFQVAVTPADPVKRPGQYRLTVKVPPGLPTGLIIDDIVLKTDHPKAGELKIPIDVSIEDKQ